LLAAASGLQLNDAVGLRDLLGRPEVGDLDTFDTDLLVKALNKSTRFRIRAIRDQIEQMHGGGKRRGERHTTQSDDPGSPLLWAADARERLRAECAGAAKSVIDCADPLDAAYEHARATFGLVSEATTFKAVLLCGASLLLDRPVSARIGAESSAGKSYVAEGAVVFIPPSEVQTWSGASALALVYGETPLGHRLLYLPDANMLLRVSTKDNPNMGAAILRSLLSEQRIEYHRVVNDERAATGARTVEISREGPTGQLACLSSNELDWDTATRVVALGVDATAGQTKEVMFSIAKGFEQGQAPLPPLHRAKEEPAIAAGLAPWHAYWRWLASFGPSRVQVPYARWIALRTPALAARMRRDFSALLGLVQAHALLNRPRRKLDETGAIIATVEDYAAAREIMLLTISRGTIADPEGAKELQPVLRGLALLAHEAAAAELAKLDQQTPRAPEGANWSLAPTLGRPAESYEETKRRECLARLADEWAVGATVTVTLRKLADAVKRADPKQATAPNTAKYRLEKAVRAEFVSHSDDGFPVRGGKAMGRYTIERAPVAHETELNELLPTPEQVAEAEKLGEWLFPDWLR
jgi:hypothetical protein